MRLSDNSELNFAFEIRHNEDFDPGCIVCTESKKIVETILGTWLQEAIIVEADWLEQNIHPGMDLRRMLILKKSDKPTLARLLDWFSSNFDDTIKLAAIDSILFREQNTNVDYECIIQY